MDMIAACTGFVSLVVAFISLYRTRKSGEQQQQIDETKTELSRQANEIQTLQSDIAQSHFNLNKRFVAAQSPAVLKVSIIQESGTYFFQFRNTGMGEASDIYFEVIDHSAGHIHKPFNHTHGISILSLPSNAKKTVKRA
jgi:negative regulator of sigma E activity